MNELTLTELDMGIAVPKILQAFKPSIDYRGKILFPLLFLLGLCLHICGEQNFNLLLLQVFQFKEGTLNKNLF